MKTLTNPTFLTDSAKRTLIAAAYFAGEPEEPFTISELAQSMADGSHGYTEPEDRHPRGLEFKSLKALVDRGLAQSAGYRAYSLTCAGWDKAMELTGGWGLL